MQKSKFILLLLTLSLLLSSFAGAFANDNTPDLSKYTQSYSTVEEGGESILVVTNTHEKELEDHMGGIIWDDASNQDGIRPTTVTIQVFDGSEMVAEKTYDLTSADANATDENTWEHLFEDLPKFKNVGETIDYSIQVTSAEAPEYTYTFNKDENAWYTTATHTPETNTHTIKVVFVDDDNRDGIRPTTVNVQLKQNNVDYGTPVEYSESMTTPWSNDYTDLPDFVVGNVGTAAVYTADVATAITGYTSSFDATDNTLYLTHTSDVKDVKVRKVWSDENNNDGYRTSSVCIILKGDTTDYSYELTAAQATADANVWEYTFEDVHVMKEGAPITYSIEESGATCAAGNPDDLASQIQECEAKGWGWEWDDETNTCVDVSSFLIQDCESSGGTWNDTLKQCNMSGF